MHACAYLFFVLRSFCLLVVLLLSAVPSLVPRPVRAIRVTRGGLEPSAIGFPDKLDR